MRKFKHKQTGIIGTVKDDGFLHFNRCFGSMCAEETLSMFFVEGSSDWEEVVQDWEVIKFKSKFGVLATLRRSGLYLSEADLVEYPFEYFIGENWKIETVKRLSDGVEFSIDDKVRVQSEGYSNITNFKGYIVTLNNSFIADISELFLKTYESFFTEEGVEINFGDEFYAVSLPSLKINQTKSPHFTKHPEKYKRFKYQENANNYKLNHSQCLSLIDIRKLTMFDDSKLIDLVKTRIIL